MNDCARAAACSPRRLLRPLPLYDSQRKQCACASELAATILCSPKPQEGERDAQSQVASSVKHNARAKPQVSQSDAQSQVTSSVTGGVPVVSTWLAGSPSAKPRAHTSHTAHAHTPEQQCASFTCWTPHACGVASRRVASCMVGAGRRASASSTLPDHATVHRSRHGGHTRWTNMR